MYRTYKEILHSDEGDIKILVLTRSGESVGAKLQSQK